MLVVGRHEDDERHALAPDRFDDLEAVHMRHLDIEEHELRRIIEDRRHGFLAVTTLAHHLDIASLDSRAASRSRASGSSSTMRVLIFFMAVVRWMFPRRDAPRPVS